MEDRPSGGVAFRCKGVNYVETLRWFDEFAPGGRAAVIARVGDADAREFLSRPFVVGGWYDVLPIEDLYRAGVLVTGRPYLELLRDVTRWTMQQQLKTVYRFILRFASPETVMKNLGRTARQYFEFVDTEVTRLGPKSFRSTGSGIPARIAPAYMATTEAGLKVILEAAGAEELRQRWLPTEDVGELHGVALVRVGREISWA